MRVPAKINLSLGVGPVGDDGFHPLATVYQAVDLQDEVKATLRTDGRFTVSVHVEADGTGEVADIPTDDDNLVVRAARLLQTRLGDPNAGADFVIRKVIPVAGGMAGGSADAAGALVACNAIWGGGLSREALEGLAAQVGSDVPFLLHGGIAVGSGRGEVISPVLARGSYHWVVAIADVGLSTPEVYAEFDRLGGGTEEPEVPAPLLAALRAGDPVGLGAALSNDLTEAALSLRPGLRATLDIGTEAGALGALISGSGPTVLFLAADEQHGMDIAVSLAAARVCADVVQARGPVPGARLL